MLDLDPGAARWECWRIEVPEDVAAARRLVAVELAPLLDRLTAEGAAEHWWFLVKHDGAPHVRLRLLAPGPALAGPDEVRDLLGDGAAYAVLEDWTVELARSGGELAAAARRGELRRGLRAILATHVVFHWNRLGLSGAVQAGLAHLVAGWIFDE